MNDFVTSTDNLGTQNPPLPAPQFLCKIGKRRKKKETKNIVLKDENEQKSEALVSPKIDFVPFP